MNPSAFIILLVCLVSVQYHAVLSHWKLHVSRESSRKYSCSFVSSDASKTAPWLPRPSFKEDQEILKLFPYFVPLNPKNPTGKETYALMNDNGQIYFMNIVNQPIIPAAISCLNHLRELNTGSTYPCGLNRQLLTKIERLPLSLIFLEIYDTKITQWPDNFGELTGLKTLELSNIGLISREYDPDHVISLFILHSLSNRLIIVPPAITNLRSLEHIILKNNAHLRSIQVLNGLPSLKILDVRGCSIERLPLNLPNLTDLYMTNNNLTDLVGIETLGTGTSYNKSFYFGMNRIKFIPPEIRNVNNLYLLNMNDNQLKDISPDMYNITTLHYLYIERNLIDNATLTTIISEMKVKNPSLDFQHSD